MELENSSPESNSDAPVLSADTNAEIAQDTESQPESDGSNEGDAPAKPKIDPFQKRINELTYRNHDAERRYNEVMAHAQTIALQNQELQRRQQEAEAYRQMPDPSAFASDDHARAFYQQESVRQQAENQRFQAHQEQQRNYQAAINNENQRLAFVGVNNEVLIAQGVTKYPDFEKVVNDPRLPDITKAHPAVLQTFYGSEKKAEIAYFLGKNPAEAHKLAQMNPVQAIAEIGRIETRLSQRGINSNAPDPLRSVPGSATSGGSLEGLSTTEYIKRRNAQMAKSRGR